MDLILTTTARTVDDVDLSDLTSAQRTGPAVWDEDGLLRVPFDRDLTADEEALIRRRLLTRDADQESEVATMQDALVALAGKTGTIAGALRVLLESHLSSTLGETP